MAGSMSLWRYDPVVEGRHKFKFSAHFLHAVGYYPLDLIVEAYNLSFTELNSMNE